MSNKHDKIDILDYESTQNLNELKQYIKSLVPFVGAGMSVSMGYKTWYEFLNSQIELLVNDTNSAQKISIIRERLNNNEYLIVASELNELFNNNLYSAIRRDFSPRENQDTPEYIGYFSQMGCTTVLTTNYDNILESHMNINGIIPETVLPYSSYDVVEKDKQGKPLIVKLHGSYNNPKSIVLTKEQYEEKYVYNNEIKDTLQYYWTSKVLLFIGCSLEKDYLIEFISHIARKDDRMYHYAIIQEPKNVVDKVKKATDLDRLKIRPIWYPHEKHEFIIEILKRIINENNTIKNIVINKQIENQCESSNFDLCSTFLDTIAVLCNTNQRNKLFYSILNTNSRLKIERLNLSSLTDEIYHCNCKNTLCIFGEPGTGKSTLLTLLFLEFQDKYNNYSSDISAYIPLYIDLHKYEQLLPIEAMNNLSSIIEKFKTFITNHQTHKVLLFLDGIDEYPRHNIALIEYVINFAKDNNYVAKVVYSVGNISTKLLPTATSVSNFTKCFNRIVKLDYININDVLFQQITKHLLNIYKIKNNKNSLIIDKVKRLSQLASGNFTDFRTVNYFIQLYAKRSEILDKEIGEIYIQSFSWMQLENFNILARQITKLVCGQNENYEQIDMVLFYKSSSIRNFMYAYNYVCTIIESNIKGMELYDSVFPSCVNEFIKSILNSNYNICTKFVFNAITLYHNLTSKQQIQILYFLGRVKYKKEKAINFLLNEYKSCLQNIYLSTIAEHDILMKYRTVGIALIYLGNHEHENEFYQKLIYDQKLNRLNRLFHIDYYTNDNYVIGEDRNLEEVKCDKLKIERLYYSLYKNIINEQIRNEKCSYYINILTIINLVIFDHYDINESIGLYSVSKYGFNKLLDKLVSDKFITNHIIKNYITVINSCWETAIPGFYNISPIRDDNIYNSFVLMFYRLKTTIRSGWLEEGRRVDLHKQPESVADHSWACCLIAMILLSDNIKMCSFMQNENLDEYSDYNKSKILELLLVHDLAESYSGDIIGDNEKKERMEKEFIEKIKTYDSFPNLKYFNKMSELIIEYSILQTINSKIAYDIDKLEPLIQTYIYKDLLESPSLEVKKWEISVDVKLKTTLGRKIYGFILMNINH